MTPQDFCRRLQKDFPSFHFDTDWRVSTPLKHIYMLNGQMIQLKVSSSEEKLLVSLKLSPNSFGEVTYAILTEGDYQFFVHLLQRIDNFS